MRCRHVIVLAGLVVLLGPAIADAAPKKRATARRPIPSAEQLPTRWRKNPVRRPRTRRPIAFPNLSTRQIFYAGARTVIERRMYDDAMVEERSPERQFSIPTREAQTTYERATELGPRGRAIFTRARRPGADRNSVFSEDDEVVVTNHRTGESFLEVSGAGARTPGGGHYPAYVRLTGAKRGAKVPARDIDRAVFDKPRGWSTTPARPRAD